jgi:hypothetical protein
MLGLTGVGGYALYQHLTDSSAVAVTASSPSVASSSTGAAANAITPDDLANAYQALTGNSISTVTPQAPLGTTYTAVPSSDEPATPTVITATPTISTQTGAIANPPATIAPAPVTPTIVKSKPVTQSGMFAGMSNMTSAKPTAKANNVKKKT